MKTAASFETTSRFGVSPPGIVGHFGQALLQLPDQPLEEAVGDGGVADPAAGGIDAAGAESGMIADAEWPEADPALLIEDEVTIAVQVNGKLRDTLSAAKGAPKADLEALALGSEKIMRQLDGATPKKIIVVPDRLVNIVA